MEVLRYIAGMQLQLGAMVNELQGVREQLEKLQENQPKEVSSKLINRVSHLQEKINRLSERLSALKDHLIDTAVQAVTTFRGKGRQEMNRVLQKGISTAKSVLSDCWEKMVDVLMNYEKTANQIDSKKVTDHHAIIPTVEIALADLKVLPETERKILSLVANRLLCATGEKHLYETVKAELTCGGYVFHTSGKSVLKNGWKDFEEAFKKSFKATEEKESEEKKLPELSEGMTFDGVQTKVSEHYDDYAVLLP